MSFKEASRTKVDSDTKQKQEVVYRVGYAYAHEFSLYFYSGLDDQMIHSKDLYCTKHYMKKYSKKIISKLERYKKKKLNIRMQVNYFTSRGLKRRVTIPHRHMYRNIDEYIDNMITY